MEEIKILSMDMGTKNFAFWVDAYPQNVLEQKNTLEYLPDGRPTEKTARLIEAMSSAGRTVLFANTDVSCGDDTKTVVSGDTLCTITELLDYHKDIFSQCDYIVVETQMQFGKLRNPKAIRVAHHVQSYFYIMFGRLARVIDFPAYNKTQVLGAPKVPSVTKKGFTRYKAVDKPTRKKWACTVAEDILLARRDWDSIDKLEDMKKKDDVSDCLLQSIAFLLLHSSSSSEYSHSRRSSSRGLLTGGVKVGKASE
jgi:hypothetical protein